MGFMRVHVGHVHTLDEERTGFGASFGVFLVFDPVPRTASDLTGGDRTFSFLTAGMTSEISTSSSLSSESSNVRSITSLTTLFFDAFSASRRARSPCPQALSSRTRRSAAYKFMGITYQTAFSREKFVSRTLAASSLGLSTWPPVASPPRRLPPPPMISPTFRRFSAASTAAALAL